MLSASCVRPAHREDLVTGKWVISRTTFVGANKSCKKISMGRLVNGKREGCCFILWWLSTAGNWAWVACYRKRVETFVVCFGYNFASSETAVESLRSMQEVCRVVEVRMIGEGSLQNHKKWSIRMIFCYFP